MARSNEQTKQKPELLKSSSFSWDKAFFTSDGVLDADELSSIIEGDGNNLKQEHLQPLPEIDNLEAKLLQEIEASTKLANKIKTQPTTSRHNSPSNNTKSPTTTGRSRTISKTGKSKSKSDLQSHLSPRTSSPSSPSSPRSPSSTSSINQRSSRGSIGSSSTNARRKDEQKPIKSYKSPQVIHSHPSSPLGLPNSSSSPSLSSSSSSSTSKKVNQRSISTGRRATTSAYHRSLTTKTGSPNGAKERKIQATKTVETVLKPNPQRSSSPSRPSRVQASGIERGSKSASKGVRNIFLVSPEVLDMKGKLNALKMEINMQKKERCKETKMVPVKIGKSESCSSIFKNSSSKMNNQARRT